MNPTELLKSIANIVSNDFNCNSIECEDCPLYLSGDNCIALSSLKNYDKIISIKR